MYFPRSQVELEFLNLSLNVVLILANSASDPDDLHHYSAFHLGQHYLPKYPLNGFQYTKS